MAIRLGGKGDKMSKRKKYLLGIALAVAGGFAIGFADLPFGIGVAGAVAWGCLVGVGVAFWKRRVN